MEKSLDADYRDLAGFVLAYEDFARRILRRTRSSQAMRMARQAGWSKELSTINKQVWSDTRTHAGQLQRDYALTSLGRQIIGALATEEERRDPFFTIWMNDYPLDALTREVQARFPQVDLARVEKLNTLYAPSFTKPANALKIVVGVIWGAGMVILNAVPEPLVRWLGGDYEVYQVTVFGITIGLAIYAAVVLTPFWIMRSRYTGYYDTLSTYLRHLTIRAVAPNQALHPSAPLAQHADAKRS